MSNEPTAIPGAQWFALHTLSGQEGKVKTYIEKFKAAEELDGFIGEVLLPTELKVVGIFEIGHQQLDSSLAIVTLRRSQSVMHAACNRPYQYLHQMHAGTAEGPPLKSVDLP